jgi:CHASE2 domain-containing sensor protein
MATGPTQRGIIGLLNGLIARLRATGGKTWADIITVFVVAGLATAAALALNRTTPVRFVENLTYDLRQAIGAPAAKPQFVIVKIDDDALNAMREASACHCLSPIDKIWLADLLAALDAKGVKATAVDYLLDTWDSPEEFAEFQRRIANTKAPIIAAVDPQLKPGVDFPVAPKLHYADARALVRVDYDDVVRRYDPLPGVNRALATETGVAAVGLTPKPGSFAIR